MTNEDDDWSDYDVIDGYSMVLGPEPPEDVPRKPDVRIEKVASRKARPRGDEVLLGRVFTDHMAMLDWNESAGWSDPRVVPFQPLALHPAAAIFRGGQEIFDGVKAFRGADEKVRLFRADQHCRRIAEGAQRLGMPPIEPLWMLALLEALVTVDREWVPWSGHWDAALYVRATLIATEPSLGARPSKQYLFFAIASPTGWNRFPLSPARAWIEESGGSTAPGELGAVKSGINYAGRLLPTEGAKARGYECVLWTGGHEPRHLRDLGTSNVVLVLGDEVVTPPLDGTVVRGVTRDAVLTLCRAWGWRTSERSVTLDELLDAAQKGTLREVFGCSTIVRIFPVTELGWRDRPIVINGGQPGALTRRLYETISDLQHARVPDPHGWLTLVD